MIWRLVIALLAAMSGVTEAHGHGRDKVVFGGKPKYGDSSFYVQLDSVVFSEGVLLPSKFSRDIYNYEVDIPNPRTKEVTVIASVDVMEYDVEYGPEMLVDDKPLKKPFNLVDGAGIFTVALNDSIAAFDQTVKITLRDPQPTGSLFNRGARADYYFRIMQPAEYDAIVKASSLAVVQGGTVLESTPAFDSASAIVDYTFNLLPASDSVEVTLGCNQFATKLAYNSEQKSFGQSQIVEVSGLEKTLLAQCSYSDEKWLHNNEVQRTYVLKFERDLGEQNTEVELLAAPTQGICEKPVGGNKGFVCRSLGNSLDLIVSTENPNAGLLLVNVRTGEMVNAPNRVPARISWDGKTASFELRVQAGSYQQKYPLQVTIPPNCVAGFKCPRGFSPTTSKAAVVKMCPGAACSPIDFIHCCDSGTTFVVELKEVGNSAQEVDATLTRITNLSTKAAASLVAAGHGVVLAEAENAIASKVVAALQNAGARAVKRRQRTLWCDLTIEAAEAPSQAVLEILAEGTDQSMEDIKAKLATGKAPIEGVTKQECGEDVKRLTKIGAAASCTPSKVPFSLLVVSLGRVILEEAARILAGALSLSEESVLKILRGRLPFVFHGNPPDIKLAAKALEKLDLGAIVDVLPSKLVDELLSGGAVCKQVKCPQNMEHVFDAAKKRCKKSPCGDEDVEYCCGVETLCKTLTCPVGHAHRAEMGKPLVCHKNTHGDCDQFCCDKAERCTTFKCDPEFWLPKVPVQSCGQKCTQKICCNLRSLCQKDNYAFDCPAGLALKFNASSIRPQSFAGTVHTSDCCGPPAPCSTFACPAGSSIRLDADRVMCSSTVCSGEHDAATCCQVPGTCLGFQCGALTVLRRNPQSLLCASHVCGARDQSTCCRPVETCDKYKCPLGSVLKRNAQSLGCRGTKCNDWDEKTCCAEVASCETMTCPSSPKPFGLLPTAGTKDCKSWTCTVKDDLHTCCEEKISCSGIVCKASTTLSVDPSVTFVNTWEDAQAICCHPFATCDQLLCPAGFMSKAGVENLFCGTETCTDADSGICCEEGRSEEALPKKIKTFDLTVKAEEGHGLCSNWHGGFWCESADDELSLTLIETVNGKEKKTKLSRVNVPAEGEVAKLVTVLVRGSNNQLARVKIWVARKPAVPFMPIGIRRLSHSSGEETPAEAFVV